MKHYLVALGLALALTGCDDANKAIDQAQQAANDAVDSLQQRVDDLDLSQLNFEQFGEATDKAKEFAASVEEAVNADYSKPEVVTQVEDHIAATYNCLVDATSESTAEKWVNGILETIGTQEAQTVVEKAIEKAKDAQECMM